jgi:phage terminase small subunit
MGKRGPKSATELMLIEQHMLVEHMGARPEAPAVLNDRAADEWRRVVNRMPSNWFTDETLSLLQMYCEHVSESEALQLMTEKVRRLAMKDDEAFDRYKRLLSMKESQTRAATTCATKLRLTHQSTYTNKSARTNKTNNGAGARPWAE